MGRDEKTLGMMYGAEDLSLAPVFQGGFINFGLWNSLPEPMTEAHRVESSKDLYRRVFSALEFSPSEIALDVGCGRGLGCDLLKKEYHVAQITGLDVTPEQVERAYKTHPDLEFVLGAAEALPFADASFTRIFSVEAAQHFLSLPTFLTEAFRVLKKSGRLGITTFFAEDEKSLAPLAELFPTVRNGIDRIIPLPLVAVELASAGFEAVQIERIGENVWEGFDRWVAQTEQASGWARNWAKAYKSQLLDYFVITAEKP